MAVVTLLWAFEHSCHAEIKTIQKLSTVTSRAAHINCQKISNRRTRATPQIRRLVACFSLRKTGFDTGEVQVGSAGGKLKTVVFHPLLRYYHVKYHPTNDPYSFIYNPVGGPQVQDSLTPSHEKNHAEARCTVPWQPQRADYHKLKPRTTVSETVLHKYAETA
jgi:hypothetical protein